MPACQKALAEEQKMTYTFRIIYNHPMSNAGRGSESEPTETPDQDGVNSDTTNYDIIKSTNLKKKLINEYEPERGSSAQDILEDQLTDLADVIWNKAVIIARTNDRSSVTESDVEMAYQQVLLPANQLYTVANKLQNWADETKQIADQSPLSTDLNDER
jgi:histone H3/H4